MAKRFTDSEKWKKPFIRCMKTPYKLLWLYILDECDHAGIWQVDFEVAQIKTGEKLNQSEALKNFGEKVVELSGGEKFFIPDYIEFQYGTLNEKNRVHESVIKILRKYDLIDNQNKPLISPLQRAKDKDKDKAKEMDKEKDKDKAIEGGETKVYPFSDAFIPFWLRWLSYKKDEHKFTYKKWESELTSIKLLFELAKGFEETAAKIIEQSIGNGWKGFFELKQENGITTKQQRTADHNADQLARVLKGDL